MTDAAILEASDLTKKFGGLVALDGVDVAIEPGERVGLIGPNGAGKTTLFNCLSGTHKPTRGTVTLDGADMTGREPHAVARHGLSRTFQISRPIRQLSIEENVMLGAHVQTRRRGEAREIAQEWLAFVGMLDQAESPAGELTAGKQKVMELARVMAMDPEVVLVDEMMAGLTPTETNEILALLRDISEQDVAIVVIEHDMQAIMNLSDRIMVLNNGEKLTEGAPEVVANDDRVIEVYLGETDE
jgi:branched-chain amino acid transport system ATP-binding protein